MNDPVPFFKFFLAMHFDNKIMSYVYAYTLGTFKWGCETEKSKILCFMPINTNSVIIVLNV